jgi:REase_DpnII-MboI
MSKETIIDGINSLLENLNSDVFVSYRDRGVEFGNDRYSSWIRIVKRFLDQHLPGESKRFNQKTCLATLLIISEPHKKPEQSFLDSGGRKVYSYLDSLSRDIKKDQYIPPDLKKKSNSAEISPSIPSPLEQIFGICDNFHRIVGQLEVRYETRETLKITDEYDVQDLLRSLLHLYFTDIRPEEGTPSSAARCSRVDFILKNENIGIEVKKTRAGLTAKKLSDELILDIHRYQSHQNCKTLICFVYDPDGKISNPRGVEIDLMNGKYGDFDVHVLIRPVL